MQPLFIYYVPSAKTTQWPREGRMRPASYSIYEEAGA